jgi:hypothetical protein
MAGLAPRCVELIRHPGSASAGVVRHMDVEISAATDGGLCLRYFVDCDARRIVVPPPAPSQPADGLWRHTCFEAFIAGQGSTAYCEFNFSPSGEWAMYGFTRYREGMAPLGRALPPRVAVSVTDDRLALEAVIPREILLGLPGGTMLRLGLAAVIERSDGGLSYWALAHPGERPDFHDPAGFVLEIERDLPW